MPGKTGYFVDKHLLKSVPFVERHTLDWILEEQQMHEDLRVKFDGSKSWEFGESTQNVLHGRGIEISPYGNIFIGYWSSDVTAPGNFIDIVSDGEFRVGGKYLKREWYKET